MSSSYGSFRSLGIFTLLMIAIVSVDSIRNLPIAAQYGTSLISFYLLAGLTFFLPLIIVINYLATRYPNTGGSYLWIQAAFGERWGFISIWLQWVYNVVWYPTIFAFISTTLAHMISPALETNRTFILLASLLFFWLLTAVNCLGMRMVGRMSIVYAILGTLLPMVLIIILALKWLIAGHPSATPLTWQALLPTHHNWLNLAFFVNILFSLLGLDVIGIHAGDVKNPQRTYPRVLALSGIIILFSLMLTSLAICIVVAPAKIGLINGLADAFKIFFAQYQHPVWGITLINLAIVLGSIGIASSWIVGLARGFHVAAASAVSNLPPIFQKLNRHDMPYAILILQGVIFTLLLVIFLLFDNMNNSYWILSSLAGQFALVYYAILFAAAFKLFRQDQQNMFCLGLLILGWVTSIVGILVGFVPPDGLMNTSAILKYEALLGCGALLFLAPLRFMLSRGKTHTYS